VQRIAGWQPHLEHLISRIMARRMAWHRSRWGLRDHLWRLLVGILAVILPLGVLSLVAPGLSASTAALLLIVAIGLSTYAADWTGGGVALVLGMLLLDLLFVGNRSDISRPTGGDDITAMAFAAIAGISALLLIQRVKGESAAERQEALAARSAATALSAIEIVAATQKRLDQSERQQLYEAIVRAVVGINRAHAGALLLATDDSDFNVAASYGFPSTGRLISGPRSAFRSYFDQIAHERRPIQIPDLQRDSRFRRSPILDTGVRAVVGAPIFGQDDRVQGLIIVGLLVQHDFRVTEIKKLEALSGQVGAILETLSVTGQRELQLQQARDEQRRLARVIATIPEAVVIAAPPDGRIVAINEAAESLFGDFEQGRLEIMLSEPDGSPIPEDALPIYQAMHRQQTADGRELLVTRADGSKVPVLASAAPIPGDEGEVAAVVGAFRDISALKEATRIKDEFVSVVSHELRSPLTPIRGFVQLVAKELDKEGGHTKQVQRLESIAGHVDRMTRLVDDLLDVSRLRTGSLEIKPEMADLVSLTNDVIEMRSASAHEHTIKLDAPEASIVGFWDPDRIQQVIDNLIGNAVKYSPDGGEIDVRLSAQRGFAEIEIEDSGPGISPGARDEIFAAFYRTPEVALSQTPGLGLGLYICHELVAAHRGEITVRDGKRGGATFVVRLPVDPEGMTRDESALRVVHGPNPPQGITAARRPAEAEAASS
jgi:PAS domain S-box-containing protein